MKNKTAIAICVAAFGLLAFLTMCKKDKADDTNNTSNTNYNGNNSPYADISNTYGYGILNNLKGIWNGPVTSSTALGSYPEWIVDLRPISAAQISAKNELDSLNSIHLSFFIAKHNNEYRVSFRNGGQFAGNERVSYFLADSVSETSTKNYYRFSEIKKGKSRAYTEVWFSNDSLYMRSYTNHYNTLTTPSMHMFWTAKLQDTSSCSSAVSTFNFPQKTLVKDFSYTFDGVDEAVYYNTGDPYNEAAQPYLGTCTIGYSFASTYTADTSKKVFLIITTQPLISGFTLNTANLKYRSRYVIVSAGDPYFTFNYMHPGTYYLYALYDADGNKTFSSGDWVSTTNTTFTLGNQGIANASTMINFTIP